MMKKPVYSTELFRKRLLACTVLCLSVALPAWAATSNFNSSFAAAEQKEQAAAEAAESGQASGKKPADVSSIPPLPPLPLGPGEKSQAEIAKAVAALPQADALMPPPVKKDSFGNPVDAQPKLADLPSPAPESSEQVSPVTDLSKVPLLPPELPKLTALEPPPLDIPSLAPPMNMPPLLGAVDPKALPESKEPEQPKMKTWQTVLAPAIVPQVTKFNYHRQLLPSTIYRARYTEPNTHLPRVIARDDYANLLFQSVSYNDVERTRALLNAGTNVNTIASNGETPLATARRIGAVQVAELLMARGGY